MGKEFLLIYKVLKEKASGSKDKNKNGYKNSDKTVSYNINIKD